jgi:oligopeptide/dipeptide ABC transporter ATP-binding protein
MALLDIRNLTATLTTPRGPMTVVDDVSFAVDRGTCFGLVGESGSGKSMTVKSVLGLLPPAARITGGRVFHDGQDLTILPPDRMARVRGRQIACVVQDAVSALNPVYRIGDQIAEGMLEHGVVANAAQARACTLDLLARVGIPAPERRIDDYPHQFSGGMCQRVVIAAALSCEPAVILADEPTTALDVTIQHQILQLLTRLQLDLGLALVLVTHDMGVVAQTCQQVAVMYAGQIVESAPVAALFARPAHPYTAGLLACVPRLDGPLRRLVPIPGAPPDLARPPPGCRFAPRCPLAVDACRAGLPPLVTVAPGHQTRCLRAAEMTPDLWGAAHG